MTVDALPITAEQLWGDTDDVDLWPTARKLIAEQFSGVVVAAPEQVAIDLRRRLPLFMLHAATLREAAVTSLEDTGVLVASSLRTGAVLADLALAPTDAELGAPSADDPGDGWAHKPYTTDVRARLGLPWAEDEWLLTVLTRDRVSNRVGVRLAPSPGVYRDPAVEEFLRGAARDVPPPSPWPVVTPGADLPTFDETPHTPALPEGAGIRLQGTRLTVTRPGERAILGGSFRLRVLERERTRDADPFVPAAIVQLGVVLVGSRYAGPTLLRLRVPAWPVEGAADEVAGRFALDLLATPQVPTSAQTYFAYAFAREVMTCPVPMAFVSPDDLPSG
jgi:hypothetical protein